MIAGPALHRRQEFETLRYNAKRSAQNQPRRSTTPPRRTRRCPRSTWARVYVLTGAGTCSASESIINSLEGVDVTVQRIGATTCGKPYGFQARDNYGISYFPSSSRASTPRAGRLRERLHATCGGRRSGHPLGNPAEARLAAAAHAAHGSRPGGLGGPGAAEPRDGGTGQRRRAGQAPGARAPTAAGARGTGPRC